MKKIVVIFMLLFSLPLAAGTLLIKGKRYLDVAKGEYIHPANILIQGDKIIAINPQSIPEQVVSGDPLKEINTLEQVDFVMKTGKIIKNQLDIRMGNKK